MLAVLMGFLAFLGAMALAVALSAFDGLVVMVLYNFLATSFLHWHATLGFLQAWSIVVLLSLVGNLLFKRPTAKE